MNRWLVDTGPLVAYLDQGDPQHERVADVLEAFHGQLVTTSAVITEAMFLLGEVPKGPTLLADLVGASDMRVYDLSGPSELREAAKLMARYADAPMDFADATLVLLAEALGLSSILTLDRRGFSIYRIGSRKPFTLTLEE